MNTEEEEKGGGAAAVADMTMAAKESVNNDLINVERVVNRWIVNYYLSLGVEFFKNEQYTDFSDISKVLDGIVGRQIELCDDLPLKIRLFKFLSLIRDAENLDGSFECNQNKTPLELALCLLETMTKRFSLPQCDCGNVITSLKEMIVGTFIKNSQFEKAKEALNQYFPRPVTGKRMTFMNLICQKNKAHEVIEKINFQSFKEEMLDFCLRLWSFTDPFLYKAAKNLVDKRHLEPDDITFDTDEQNQPSSSCSLPKNTVHLKFRKPVVIQRVRLEVAYTALAKGLGGKTFAQLKQEVEMEAQENEICLEHLPDPTSDTNLNAEQTQLFQRDSCSPMEASPADQPPQSDTDPQTQTGSLSLYTVPRLVTEPDSQPSSLCTMAADELETEVELHQTPQTVSSRDDLDNMLSPVTDKEVIIPMPERKYPRRSRASSSFAKCSADHDEDSLESVGNNQMNDEDPHDRPNKSVRKSGRLVFTSSESENELEKQLTPCRTPEQRPPEPLSSCSPIKRVNPDGIQDCLISDSSLDSLPSESSRPPVSKRSSTPRKVTRASDPSRSKWNELVKNAKETKDTWSDEESNFNSSKNNRLSESINSYSRTRKRKWTESETQKLKDGVKTFGEGNWSKIQSYYNFKDRTNVNLKDRWRTMKKLNLV